jgi:polar amino acid transport system substrate-binding protein
VTPERSKTIQFSEPYAQIGLALLTRQDPSIQEARDLNSPDRTLITKRGTSGHLFVEKLFPKAKHLVVEKDAAAYLEVSQGKADAFLYDQLSVVRAQQRYPQTTKALLTPLREEKWALGLRKADHELLQQVNIFLLSFQKQKGFEKLAKKYLSQEALLFRQSGIPFIFTPTP